MIYPDALAIAQAHPLLSTQRIVKFCMALLIFVSIALPSGTLFGIPIKYVAFGLALLSLFALWVRHSLSFDRWLLTLGVFVTAYVTFFVLVGLFKGVAGPPFILKEATGFFTAIFIVLMVLTARSQGAIDDKDIARYAFYGAFVFALWKSMIVFGLVSKVLSYDMVSAFFMEQAGYRLVSSGIYGGWVRINLIIYDFIVAFMLFLVPSYPALFDRVPRLLRYAFVLIGFCCLVFAFSRLLFGLAAVLFLFAFLFRFSLRTKVLLSIVLLATLIAAAPWLEGAFEQRFRSSNNTASDALRTEQIEALVDAWGKAPLLGGGFGYYARSMVRDPSAPYNYEVQWVGFLAKLGVIGVLGLCLLVAALYLNVFRGPVVAEHFVIAFTLSCFILGGFTNQYLVTSGSGVFYCLILSLANHFRKRQADALPGA